MTTRRGFTIIELLIVAVLGTLLMLAAYQVLITNRRVFTVQNQRVATQQSTRSAMDVLFAELREVSSNGGDVIAMGPDSLAVRGMREIGAVCDPLYSTHGSNPQLLVRKVIDFFENEDSVYVFADNDEFTTADDTWFRARVSAIDTTVTCPDGSPAQRMTFAGQSAAFAADSVSTGAPVRSFIHLSYSLGTYNSQPYLGRTEAGGSWVPLVGPLVGRSGQEGLEMTYLDAAGNPVGAPAAVRQIQVKLRSWGKARTAGGDLVVDSLSSRIYMRN